MRIIVGVSGATGTVLAFRLLEALKTFPPVETHVVISDGAKLVMKSEQRSSIEVLEGLVDRLYPIDALDACISSGSFKTAGMVVIPCSMKSLSAIANGYADNLLTRAADVCLKESRRTVLVPREMPLGRIHLRNMLTASENGCVIIPPQLTFYNGASTIEAQMDHIIGKILMQFDLEYDKFEPWAG